MAAMLGKGPKRPLVAKPSTPPPRFRLFQLPRHQGQEGMEVDACGVMFTSEVHDFPLDFFGFRGSLGRVLLGFLGFLVGFSLVSGTRTRSEGHLIASSCLKSAGEQP